MKYLGGGFIPGVPARDLTDEEAAQHAKAIAASEKATKRRLYEQRSPDVTDAALEAARKEGVDLTTVEGSGKGGRVTVKDIATAKGESGEAATD